MLSHYFKNIDVIVKGAVAMFSAHEKNSYLSFFPGFIFFKKHLVN